MAAGGLLGCWAGPGGHSIARCWAAWAGVIKTGLAGLGWVGLGLHVTCLVLAEAGADKSCAGLRVAGGQISTNTGGHVGPQQQQQRPGPARPAQPSQPPGDLVPALTGVNKNNRAMLPGWAAPHHTVTLLYNNTQLINITLFPQLCHLATTSHHHINNTPYCSFVICTYVFGSLRGGSFFLWNWPSMNIPFLPLHLRKNSWRS